MPVFDQCHSRVLTVARSTNFTSSLESSSLITHPVQSTISYR
ncbi:unnamed protein product, partial [Vitis vinifera]|uniref:Uncharacterized protein n=1 Tax=Vitis vinifera TaxID=29760 RepID=D7SW59_VITVI